MERRVEGEFMDMKILAAALAISLIALVGVAFAMPNWNNGNFGAAGQNRTLHNATWKGPCQNATWQNATWHGRGNWNLTRPNATDIEQFKYALQAEDYQAAKHFYDAYGIGGRLFGRLNETTFVKYARICNLQSELRQELGLNEQQDYGPMLGRIEGPRGVGFGRIMRHPITHGTKNKTTS
jgi:hypothetical protein